MVTQVRVREVDRPVLIRLVAKARTDGIKLYRAHDGRHYASSASKPGTLHYVTGFSCDCQGFMSHQRCKHHAALLTALGWIPAPPPAAAAEVTCPTCNGLGEEPGLGTRQFSSWMTTWEPCRTCAGTGTVTCGIAA